MIREATLKDLPDLLRLYDQLRGGLSVFKKAPTRPNPDMAKAFRRMLSSRDVRLLVWDSGGQVRGTCAAYILPRVYYSGKPLGILDTIVVDDRERGQGIGRALIREAVELCKKAGCHQVNLTSNTQRTRAHRFYESLGFEPTYVGFKKMLYQD